MKRSAKGFFWTYLIILLIAFFAFIIRWISLQFSFQFNIALFFSSLVVLSTGWEILRALHFRLNRLIPFERSIAGRIAVQLAVGVIVATGLRFCIFKFGEPYLPIHLDSLFMATTWAIFPFVACGINTAFFVQYFVGRWKDSLVREERLEKEKAYIQFENLRNQLNPHFLFNALTSLNLLITENPVLASQFLQQMAKVYRYVLQHKEKNAVSLQTELDFIKHYVFLAETRFGGALKITFSIIPDSLESCIVPVTSQVLIENAIKHNVVDSDRPLSIDVSTTSDYFIVSNNFQKRRTVETSNNQGLANLKSLYKFMTPRPVIIEADSSRFVVKIPLLEC